MPVRGKGFFFPSHLAWTSPHCRVRIGLACNVGGPVKGLGCRV